MESPENKENADSPKTACELKTKNEDDETNNGQDTVSFIVVFNKKKYDITFNLDKKISDLKNHLFEITGIPASMQKLTFKGIIKDESSLRESNITNSTKILLIGSTVNDLLKIVPPDPSTIKSNTTGTSTAESKDPLSKQKPHCVTLEKYGKPDDAMIGIKNKQDRLPPVPISGMYNSKGGKVRLTFKIEVDEVWISTKERTNKVKMTSIQNVISEPISGREEYSMLALQLGPTEQSRMWIYWVPTQYTAAIKDTILGHWQKI